MYSLDFLLSICNEENYYMIDIGAQYGPGPTFKYLSSSEYSGLAIEGSEHSYKVLCSNLPNPKVDKHLGFVTPDNVCNIFEKYHVPKTPDILKIDIDGYDLSVLRSILSKYTPKIITCEINEKIPPPVYFEVKYSPTYEWDTSHFFGFSLQAGYDILSKYGYTLVYLEEGNNGVFIHKDFFDKTLIEGLNKLMPKDIYKRDYLDSKIYQKFPWNSDIHHWTTINDTQELIKDIFDYFTTTRKMRSENLGQPISPEAFVLK